MKGFNMKIIETQNLYKIYGKGSSEVKALQDINLLINKEEFISIVGTSGSGKSTLLHMISGLDNPSSGKIFFNENNISNVNQTELTKFRSENIGFVFQFFNLIPILTVEENILLPVLINGLKPDKEYIFKLIDILGIKDILSRSTSKLSGGQQQRVAIARALSNKPAIIYADEPTGNLDRKASKEIIKIFEDTSTELKQTIIIVTHDTDIASHTNRIIELEDGRIINDEKK
jgi:putative ABC transport system ATP-binding protein